MIHPHVLIRKGIHVCLVRNLLWLWLSHIVNRYPATRVMQDSIEQNWRIRWLLLLFRYEAERDRINGGHYQLLLLVHKWLELDIALREHSGRHHHGMVIMRSRWCLCQSIAWWNTKRRSGRHDQVLMLLLPRIMSCRGVFCVLRMKMAGRRRHRRLLILRKRRICHRLVRHSPYDASTRNRNEGGTAIITIIISLMRLLILRQYHGGSRHLLEVGWLVEVLYRDETSPRVATAVSCSLAAEGSIITLAHTIMNGHNIKMRIVISIETISFVYTTTRTIPIPSDVVFETARL